MECVEEALSHWQIQAAKRAEEEYRAALQQIRVAQAEVAAEQQRQLQQQQQLQLQRSKELQQQQQQQLMQMQQQRNQITIAPSTGKLYCSIFYKLLCFKRSIRPENQCLIRLYSKRALMIIAMVSTRKTTSIHCKHPVMVPGRGICTLDRICPQYPLLIVKGDVVRRLLQNNHLHKMTSIYRPSY